MFPSFMKRVSLLFFLFASAAIFTALPTQATTLISDPSRTAFEALAVRADAAVHVEVTNQTYRLVGGRIVTDSECRVLAAGYGANAGETITVTTLGGRWGLYAQKIDGIEAFVPGDHLAMLLTPPGYMAGGRMIVGFSYGIFRSQGESADTPLFAVDRPFPSGVSRESQARSDDTPASVGEFLARATAAKGAR